MATQAYSGTELAQHERAYRPPALRFTIRLGKNPVAAASLAMCTDQRSVVLEFANAHSGGRTA